MPAFMRIARPGVGLALIAVTLAGCADWRSPTAADPTPVAAPTPTVSPTPTAQPAPAASAAEQACTRDVLLPLMKAKFDDPAAGLVIEDVDIKRCQGGYVHLFAISRRNSTGSNFDNEQLFMRFVDGEWQSVSEGTGISCHDPDIRPELLVACRVLGYVS
jgi:hypothetical protein